MSSSQHRPQPSSLSEGDTNVSFQVAPADGFSDLAMQVMTSPSKNYILSVISGSICILFLIGLMCGRITKRVTRELKDR